MKRKVHRFQKIKDQFFDPRTKEARIKKALSTLAKVPVITNLDNATWKIIAEDVWTNSEAGVKSNKGEMK